MSQSDGVMMQRCDHRNIVAVHKQREQELEGLLETAQELYDDANRDWRALNDKNQELEGRVAELKRDFFEADSLRATYEDRCGELEGLLREWSGTGIADCHCWNTDLRKRTDAALEDK